MFYLFCDSLQLAWANSAHALLVVPRTPWQLCWSNFLLVSWSPVLCIPLEEMPWLGCSIFGLHFLSSWLSQSLSHSKLLSSALRNKQVIPAPTFGYVWSDMLGCSYGSASQCPGSSTGQCLLGSAIVRSCLFHRSGVRYALCSNLQESGFYPIRNRNNIIIITGSFVGE